MNVDSILLSQFAHTQDAALTVYQTFNQMEAGDLPAQVPLLAVSLVIHGHRDEGGTRHEVEIRLLDEDRNVQPPTPLRREFEFKPGPPPPGMPLRHVLVNRIFGLRFEEAGTYAFEVYIDGTYHATTSFYLAGPEG